MLKAGVKPEIIPFVWPKVLDDETTLWAEFVNAFQDAEWRYYIDSPKAVEKPVSVHNSYGFTVDDGFVIVYVHGACSNNGKLNAKAGIGVWFNHNHGLNVSKPLRWGIPAKSNAAHFSAVLRAISIVKGTGLRRLAIHSNSEYLIKSVQDYAKEWLCNGWLKAAPGKPVKHKKYFRKYYRMTEEMSIKWVFISKEDKVTGSIEAEKMAKEGAKFYRPCPFQRHFKV